jgi:hypothetical protein
MNEPIVMPERVERRERLQSPTALRFSTITFYSDMSKVAAPVIPIGIMAEILLPHLWGVGLIARIELSADEMALVSELPKQLVAKPFDYLAREFNEAWKAGPGGALDYVTSKYECSALHFNLPQQSDVPLQFITDMSQSTVPILRTAVRAYLGTILDDQMSKLISKGAYTITNPQEEILQLKAA